MQDGGYAGAGREGAGAVGTVRIEPTFHGSAGEYFGIWIVNVLLTIITLGIYSAWATVRTERYFYGNTRLAGSAFEYMADPIRILKGRLIAYAVLVVLVLSSHFMPLLYVALLLVVAMLVPLLTWLAARFRARYSAWRGVRFHFDGGAGAAYGPFFGWVILSGITLSLLYPIARMRQQAYLVDGHRFGRTRFAFRGEEGQYYVPYAITVGLGILLFIGVSIGMGALVALLAPAADAGSGAAPDKPRFWAIYGFVLLVYAGVFALMGYLRTRYLNLMWRNTRLGDHRFESTLRVRDVIWIYASNLVAIVCTLGLATPWAMVRLARYRAGHFAVLVSGGLDDFIAGVEEELSSAGAEVVDALDLGVDIGL